MALELRLQAAPAFYCKQISGKNQAHLVVPVFPLSKDKRTFDILSSCDLCSGNGTLPKGLFHYNAKIGSKIFLGKKGDRMVVSASMPSLVPTVVVQIASRLFTFGTAFVVPFYTVMILAPHAPWTRKLVESSVPYVVLGVLYAYLLALSWSPETLPLMFASKYWLPELSGITRMFSSPLTVASAWLHLLAVDLFAGRHIYLDGLQHGTETRHSLILCLLFSPIGMLSHFFTKAVVQLYRKANVEDVPNVAEIYS